MKSLQTVNVELEFKLAQNGLRPSIFHFESLRQRLEEAETYTYAQQVLVEKLFVIT